MRLIAAKALLPGNIVGRDIIFDKNRVLIRQGAALVHTQIERIVRMGFQGVYIEDALSHDIIIQPAISDALRQKTLALLRPLFTNIEQDIHRKSQEELLTLLPVIKSMIKEISEYRERMPNLTDICCFDDYTYTHSVNVAVLSILLGVALGMSQHMLTDLALSAFAQDIGKLFIDKRIINKQSKLTFDEFEEVKRHSIAGYNYLNLSGAIPALSKSAVLSHHEQFNGAGYPGGLAGEAIPLFGRILCIADVYDALICARPFRNAMLPCDAVEYIVSGYNTSFDPTIVDAFMRKVAPYPVGTCVQLSNNIVGIVVENFEGAGMRPKLRVIENGQATAQYINLAHDYAAATLTIRGVAAL